MCSARSARDPSRFKPPPERSRYSRCEVVLAESGEEALILYKRRALEGKPVKVVLRDMTLPGGMCGQDSTKEILRHDPFAKVIATSGYFDDTDADQFLELGFHSVISKPYDLQKLSHTLHRALQD